MIVVITSFLSKLNILLLTNSDWTKYSMHSRGKENHNELWTVRGDGAGAISDL